MIEIEVEDPAWLEALPEVEVVVERAANAALQFSSPPQGGRGRERGLGRDVSVKETGGAAIAFSEMSSTPPPTLPFPPGGGRIEITILLTDDASIQDLNARFRGKDAATNVLSFPAAASAHPHLGDIALAYGVCEREAEEQSKPLAHHLTHLTVHGVLHLLGYDHEAEVEAEEMEGMEREILATLGVPDPYAHPARGGDEAYA